MYGTEIPFNEIPLMIFRPWETRAQPAILDLKESEGQGTHAEDPAYPQSILGNVLGGHKRRCRHVILPTYGFGQNKMRWLLQPNDA